MSRQSLNSKLGCHKQYMYVIVKSTFVSVFTIKSPGRKCLEIRCKLLANPLQANYDWGINGFY